MASTAGLMGFISKSEEQIRHRNHHFRDDDSKGIIADTSPPHLFLFSNKCINILPLLFTCSLITILLFHWLTVTSLLSVESN